MIYRKIYFVSSDAQLFVGCYEQDLLARRQNPQYYRYIDDIVFGCEEET